MRQAFGGRNAVEILHATLHEQPPALTGSPAVAAADRVIRRALAKRPAERPASAEAMAAGLRGAGGPDGGVALGSGVARARRFEPGDPFPLRAWDGTTLRPRIREILPAESELVAADLVILSEGDYRRLFGTAPGLFTDVALTLRNGREAAAVARGKLN